MKRPDFEGARGGPVKDDQDSEDDDTGKKNFEATSDEDGD